jgi:hypothetical protein
MLLHQHSQNAYNHFRAVSDPLGLLIFFSGAVIGPIVISSLPSRLDLFDGERAGPSLNPRPQFHGLAQIDFDGTAAHRQRVTGSGLALCLPYRPTCRAMKRPLIGAMDNAKTDRPNAGRWGQALSFALPS